MLPSSGGSAKPDVKIGPFRCAELECRPLGRNMEPEKEPLPSPPETSQEPQPAQTLPLKRRVRLMLVLLLLLALMALNLAIGSHKLMIEQVVSESMVPTLLVGDKLLADANALPRRQDIIVLKDPTTDGDKLVKRLVGMPGDTVRIENGKVYVNNEQEPVSRKQAEPISWRNLTLQVPEDQIFVMGDNRNNSYDSLNFGPVPIQDVEGVVQATIWPPTHWGRPR